MNRRALLAWAIATVGFSVLWLLFLHLLFHAVAQLAFQRPLSTGHTVSASASRRMFLVPVWSHV